MSALAFVDQFPTNTAGPFPEQFTAVWDDVFELPASNPNDVYRVTEVLGGPSNTGFLSLGSITDNTICDIHYFGNAACTIRRTLLASQANTAVNSGQFQFTFTSSYPIQSGPGGITNLTNFEALLMLDRFLPDGTTPDPFPEVPEPGAGFLLVCGALILLSLSRLIPRVATQLNH